MLKLKLKYADINCKTAQEASSKKKKKINPCRIVDQENKLRIKVGFAMKREKRFYFFEMEFLVMTV